MQTLLRPIPPPAPLARAGRLLREASDLIFDHAASAGVRGGDTRDFAAMTRDALAARELGERVGAPVGYTDAVPAAQGSSGEPPPSCSQS